MSQELLIRSQGNRFLVPDQNDQTREIPNCGYRNLILSEEEEAVVSEDRRITISVSSDLPYNRGWYYEILDHSPDAVDLSRLNSGGGMCLFGHIRGDYLGVIEKAWLDGNKQYNQIRFGTHQRAEQIVRSINEKIIRNVSIGYEILELILIKTSEEDFNTYKATKWTPFETSFVDIPADYSVGEGRQHFDLGGTDLRGKSESHPGHQSLDTHWERDTSGDNGEELEKNISQVNEGVENFRSENKIMSDESSNVVIEKDEILRLERERTQCILAAGKKLNCPELAEKAITENMDVRDARIMMFEQINDGKQQQAPVSRTLKPVDLDKKEEKRYSMLKAIGFKAGKVSAKDAGLEIEVSDYIMEERVGGKPPEGIYVDTARLASRSNLRGANDFYRAPLQTFTPEAAGDIVDTNLLPGRFIDYLYNNSAFLPLGVTYLRDLSANLKIPRMMTATKGYWVEEGGDIPEDNLTVDTIALNPKKIGVFSGCTFEMIQQSSIDVEQLMRNAIIAGIALEIDRTVGFGSGIGEEPLGITSSPGVNSISLGVNGGALDWAAVIRMQELIDSANAMIGRFGYVFNSRSKGKLMRTLDHDTGGGSWIWQPGNDGVDGRIAGYLAHCSNQIPNNLPKGTQTNLTAGFYGNFSEVYLGLWSGLDIIVDEYTQAKQGIINIIAKQLCDLEISRGDYFSVVTDIQNN